MFLPFTLILWAKRHFSFMMDVSPWQRDSAVSALTLSPSEQHIFEGTNGRYRYVCPPPTAPFPRIFVPLLAPSMSHSHKRQCMCSRSSSTSTQPALEPAKVGKTSATLTCTESKRDGFEWKHAGRAHKDVLVDQLKSWTSSAYNHFLLPKIKVNKKTQEVCYVYACKKHLSVELSRMRWDDSTSNFIRHIWRCDGQLIPSASCIEDFAQGSTYSEECLRLTIALWICQRHRPFKIVQDPEFLAIVRMLYAKAKVPSASTVSRDIQEIFSVSQRSLADGLKEYCGKVHICIDGWTSPNVISFLGVTLHCVIDGKLQSIILDFIKLTQAHTGKYLAEKLEECLKVYHIEKRYQSISSCLAAVLLLHMVIAQLLAITMDNASNNDIVAKQLGDLDGMCSSLTRIWCFGHVWNLTVKVCTAFAIILPFTKSTKSKTTGASLSDAGESDDNDDNDEDTILLSALDLSDDDEGDSDNDEELDTTREAADLEIIEEIVVHIDDEDLLTAEEKRLGRYTVTKLLGLAKHVFHSPMLREDLASACENAAIPSKQLVRAIATLWNSLADAIGRALELCAAIDCLLTLSKYDKAGKKGLQAFKLSAQEWILLQQLHEILKVFLRATEQISKLAVPLLHQVISLIDILTTHLEKAIADPYLLRLVSYFRQHGWEPEWITIAESILQEQYNLYYRVSDATTTPVEAPVTHDDLFAELNSWGTSKTDDPIGDFLKSDIVPCDNLIAYWMAIIRHHPLVQMALDFLSAPAASVDVERTFSRGGLTISKCHHGLSDESICSATVLGSWSALDGLIPESDLLEHFWNKSKRSGRTAARKDAIDVDEDSSSTGSDVEIVDQ
ncbi:hypothetical protein NM688_g1007 [Phlebia brevispora]|uniref:Uncharacterized protein n=1 Tax=Phlebia brevispora TaxID=194682 RepID=A0ACC1TCW8_9APHY|nr:hypothetical protein NM688_g1007 [Phlebia brevispora]